MNIPNLFDISYPLIAHDPKSSAEPKVHQLFRQLFNELQGHLSDEGYVLPQQPQSNVTTLQSAIPIGTLLYNVDTQSTQLSNSGTYEDIYTRPPQLTTVQRLAIPVAKINGSWVYDTTSNELFYGINSAWREVAFT